ncbi:uncharacterized protein LOC143042895 isoform X1 [Mytilus galloprovincialis]|uniref:uncharacterized protein LOC143042895 isoform X1 n=1 Tax=Mytilus galloprovincialis TaxID=29158 RepID=UPI003F7C7C5C
MNSSPNQSSACKKQLKRLEYNRKWILEKRKVHKQSISKNTESSDEDNDIESFNSHQKFSYANSKHELECHSGQKKCRKTNTNAPSETNTESDSSEKDYTPSLEENEWDIVDKTEKMLPISESDTDEGEKSLADDLKTWANQFEVKQNCLDALLRILKNNGLADELPSCARTLLKTPRIVELKTVSEMSYYHFGLRNMIDHNMKKISKDFNLDQVQNLNLSFNIDGLPFFKSSNTSVWPILCLINNIKESKVFPISFALGTSKPANLDFLNDTVNDLLEICRDGFVFDGRNFTVSISCIICDAPAKALVKNNKQYSGYCGCDRCNQNGEYIGRMTYPQVSNLTQRTDESFRKHEQVQHHKGNSPITQLPIDMIKCFPIDYMHQVCLGVTKRLLVTWMRGPRGDYRLSGAQIRQISENLVALKKNVPREFARKPRPLLEIDRWKATEFRQFLLYTGQFALKGVLSPPYYKHFMALSVAISILVSEKLTALHSEYAQDLLEHFVNKGRELYGREFLVYNVHSLVHLKDDACQFACLENCAAWKFESYMQHLKRKIRGGNLPAAQLVKRIQEELTLSESIPMMKERKIYCKEPNNAFKTSHSKFCEVVYADSSETFMCRIYHSQEAQFLIPCDSRIVGVTRFHHLNYAMKSLRKDFLTQRCMMVKQERYVVFLPLLHDFQV